MSLDPTILTLTALGHSFFCLSPTEARRLAVLAVEISSPEDNESDIIDLMGILWRANRDAQRIEESDRHLPVCLVMDTEELPESFLLEVEELRPSRYSALSRPQPRGLLEYPGFPPPWAPKPPSREEIRQQHYEQQVQREMSTEERRRILERDLRNSFGE
jgi:hypothetical protein